MPFPTQWAMQPNLVQPDKIVGMMMQVELQGDAAMFQFSTGPTDHILALKLAAQQGSLTYAPDSSLVVLQYHQDSIRKM